MTNNILTASRMVAFLQCPRKHYWTFEVGLRPTSDGLALRFGAAWTVALECRAKGMKYDDALERALNYCNLDELACETLAALLAGYYKHYAKEPKAKLIPEKEFRFELGFGNFIVAGKLDLIGTRKDKSRFKLESKTTNDPIGPDSQYWMRLKFNMQVLQYEDAMRRENWHGDFIYDVTRKPQIHPKDIQEIDADGLVIVRDVAGQRVKNSRTGEWKKTADKTKGEIINVHTETPSEFGARLLADTLARPDFYFVRKEINILKDDLEQFREQRISIAEMILDRRQKQQKRNLRNPEAAWPRNVLESTCTYCPFKSFCLQNIDIDPANPPEGFLIQPFNPELSQENNTTPQDDSTSE
jgi:hypothetical protein